VAPRSRAPHERQRMGGDVELPRQPPGVRRRRPRDPGAWRHRLFAPHAVRAHLPPPPALPHHRGLRGDPDPPRRRSAVRLLGRTEGIYGSEAMTKPARRWTGDAVMLVTALLMGSSYPVAKDVLAVMSPLLYSSTRYAVAGAFLLGVIALRRQPL